MVRRSWHALSAGARSRRLPDDTRQKGGERPAGGDSWVAEQKEPPRLLLRFALYTAAGLAVAGAVILMFVRHHGTVQAEGAVTFHARFVAQSILAERLQPADFKSPLPAERRAELDTLFERQVLIGGTLRLALYSPDGRVTYSNEHSLVGRKALDAVAVGRALRQPVTDVAALDNAVANSPKVLKAFVPVRVDGAVVGVLELDQDYAPIAKAAQQAFLPIAGVLQLALLFLYVALFPVLRRVTKTMTRHWSDMQHQALHDALTGLPNRALFQDRTDQALRTAKREREGLAIMLIDLDRFKEVNDTLGHHAGDALLEEFARRLRGMLRETDTLARLGGDEFALLTPGAGDVPSALFVAQRIRQEMERPFVVGGLSLTVEASIGIALYPEHGEDVETLLRHADVAMYESKRAHVPKVYAATDDPNTPARLALVGSIRRALENEEFVVHFQPQVEVRTGAVRSVEALVRWNHPDLGLLPPSEFIPAAQDTGLIRPLTQFVLDEALRRAREWQDAGLDVRVAVNLSGRDLLDVGFPDDVDAALAKWDVPPACLELEVPESTFLSDPGRVRSVLTRLSERGVKLAIDDFGSGYSSLTYLKRLPVDVLKIDKSFVTSMASDDSDAMIVRSTIDLGHNLGLEVVAEGVETEETRNRLAALECDTLQGFLVMHPAPPDDVTSWLVRQNGKTQAAAKRRKRRGDGLRLVAG